MSTILPTTTTTGLPVALHWSAITGTPPVSMAPLEASVETPPASDTSVSTPASVWSDGDRERLPTRALIDAAAIVIARLAAAGDMALGRTSKLNAQDLISTLLHDLSEAGLLSAHVLVCTVSLATRCSFANIKSVSSFTIKRVLSACTILAAKAESDEQYTLASYATITELSTDTLKATELQVFERLDYSLGTSAASFQSVVTALLAEAPDYELL